MCACKCVVLLLQNYPENSIGAFEGTSSTIDSVATLETDVHIR